MREEAFIVVEELFTVQLAENNANIKEDHDDGPDINL